MKFLGHEHTQRAGGKWKDAWTDLPYGLLGFGTQTWGKEGKEREREEGERGRRVVGRRQKKSSWDLPPYFVSTRISVHHIFGLVESNSRVGRKVDVKNGPSARERGWRRLKDLSLLSSWAEVLTTCKGQARLEEEED